MNGDCRQVRELMDSYISGELTVESNHDVLRHVERCEACRSELARRERMGALLIESFGAAPDATAFGARLTQALDRDQHRWGRLARYGSIAAALILIAGAAAWLSRPVDAAAFDDSVDDHIACALQYPPSADLRRESRCGRPGARVSADPQCGLTPVGRLSIDRRAHVPVPGAQLRAPGLSRRRQDAVGVRGDGDARPVAVDA